MSLSESKLKFNNGDYKFLGSKLALAVRLSRAALGVSQSEFAAMLGVSKPTIVRIETMDTNAKADFYMRLVEVMKEQGLRVDIVDSEGVLIEADRSALSQIEKKIETERVKRSGRTGKAKAASQKAN